MFYNKLPSYTNKPVKNSELSNGKYLKHQDIPA